MTSNQLLLDEDDLINITGSLVNFQDTALVLSVVFGLTREEIINLKIGSIHPEHIDLDNGHKLFPPKVQDLDLILSLRKAEKETERFSENGHTGIEVALIDNGNVFKSGDGFKFDIDKRLSEIGRWFAMESYFTYDNLRKTGEQLGLIKR